MVSASECALQLAVGIISFRCLPLALLDDIRTLLDYDPDSGIFRWKLSRPGGVAAGNEAGSIDSHGYRRIRVLGRQYKAHALAWFLMTGALPNDEIDHVDLNRQNNSWSNLRLASKRLNMFNRRVNPASKSGLKGAYAHTTGRLAGRFSAFIAIGEGKKRYLGLFDTAEDAHQAYMKAAGVIAGEFARA